MVGDQLQDQTVAVLPELLAQGDVVVFNNTRVIPARLVGAIDRPGRGTVEITLHKEIEPARWKAFARPAKKLITGTKILFSNELRCVVNKPHMQGETDLTFNVSGSALRAQLELTGSTPLPPYIARPEGALARDRRDYQTIYAEHDGAVAAPTAGLHITETLLDALDAKGVIRTMVTLHVGAGTFLPVKVDDTEDHVMHAEWGRVNAATAEIINAARKSGGRIIAVGTTSLRLLEAAADENGVVKPFEGDTSLFITPGYRFKAVDLLLTNFHLPRSTLFMLVAAFAGLDRMQSAYTHAKSAGYRFYSFGDACLLKMCSRDV
jgi:S-adenosylmethionine:tRNA ribosyltransferase-isomerase